MLADADGLAISATDLIALAVLIADAEAGSQYSRPPGPRMTIISMSPMQHSAAVPRYYRAAVHFVIGLARLPRRMLPLLPPCLPHNFATASIRHDV
jgi:hypothetical protein